MDPASIAILSAASLAAASYLNAKLSISTDLKQLRYDREWGERLVSRIQAMGDTCSLYRMMEFVSPEVEALWFEGRSWTYGELKLDADRLAELLYNQGVKADEFVAVFTTNSPEMVITALALSKLSAVAALINTNLRDNTLAHCLDVSTAKVIISTPDLSQFVPDHLTHYSLSLYAFPNLSIPSNSPATSITLTSISSTTPTLPAAKRKPEDLALLIYTSGTSGKPKACAIKNHQLMVVSNPLSNDLDEPSKYFPLRTYSALPLFHGTCFFTGICYSIGTSSTFCLARKFSSSRFWKDVAESRATRILYVGELCRYLIFSPPSPYDRGHTCIVATGNGLRGDVWDKFRERFGVPEVREFYRSTEGLAKYDNFNEGSWGVGKIGFAGPIRRYLEKDTFIIKHDLETGLPYRDSTTGFCIKTALGEPGEVIGRVKSRALLTEYLNNEAATEEKILRDVFAKGDSYQRMGDLMAMDGSGWVTFLDRSGDTYRWKGENVSAGEVRDHIAKLVGVQDAVVYGVKLKSYDGQAGAAAITLTTNADEVFMRGLFASLRKSGVPQYAVPRLVRITKDIATGVTFKQAKGDYAKKSWNKNRGADRDVLYWLNGSSYVKLDENSWRDIEAGRAKL